MTSSAYPRYMRDLLKNSVDGSVWKMASSVSPQNALSESQPYQYAEPWSRYQTHLCKISRPVNKRREPSIFGYRIKHSWNLLSATLHRFHKRKLPRTFGQHTLCITRGSTCQRLLISRYQLQIHHNRAFEISEVDLRPGLTWAESVINYIMLPTYLGQWSNRLSANHAGTIILILPSSLIEITIL